MAVSPPGFEVTVYDVIAEPLSEVGAVKATEAFPFPGVTVVIVGTPGVVNGVAEPDAAEATPSPARLVALTVKVYAVPRVKPVTVSGDVAPVADSPPGFEVTV